MDTRAHSWISTAITHAQQRAVATLVYPDPMELVFAHGAVLGEQSRATLHLYANLVIGVDVVVLARIYLAIIDAS